jgi:hypothetical protein
MMADPSEVLHYDCPVVIARALAESPDGGAMYLHPHMRRLEVELWDRLGRTLRYQCPECEAIVYVTFAPLALRDEGRQLDVRTITVGDFTPQEQKLAFEIADLEVVVGPSDWFLRSVIDDKRRSLNRLVSQRIADERDSFLTWKRAIGIARDDDLDGVGVVNAIASHARKL